MSDHAEEVMEPRATWASTNQTMWAIVTLAVACLATFACVAIFDKGDKGLNQLVNLLNPIVTACIGLFMVRKNAELKVMMNGRLSQLLETTAADAHKDGVLKGMAINVSCPVARDCPGGCPIPEHCPQAKAAPH
jgi:hypothetical protein